MKKLRNSKAELNKGVAYKNRVVDIDADVTTSNTQPSTVEYSDAEYSVEPPTEVVDDEGNDDDNY